MYLVDLCLSSSFIFTFAQISRILLIEAGLNLPLKS